MSDSDSSNARRIGLIADSHGDREATEEAIRLLRESGADLLVHLGDFSDSVRHERTAEMIDLLGEENVLAVKGNNDFLVESLLADPRRKTDAQDKRTLAFLKTVPMMRVLDGIRFAHSLPFDALRSFYEPIDTGNTLRAASLFAEADFRILFCGHSHIPVLFRNERGKVTRETMAPGERRILTAPRGDESRLRTRSSGDGTPVLEKPGMASGRDPGSSGREGNSDKARYIAVVGAAMNGECALYDRETGAYERLRIHR
jgi:putative phosphoesterase